MNPTPLCGACIFSLLFYDIIESMIWRLIIMTHGFIWFLQFQSILMLVLLSNSLHYLPIHISYERVKNEELSRYSELNEYQHQTILNYHTIQDIRDIQTLQARWQDCFISLLPSSYLHLFCLITKINKQFILLWSNNYRYPQTYSSFDQSIDSMHFYNINHDYTYSDLLSDFVELRENLACDSFGTSYG